MKSIITEIEWFSVDDVLPPAGCSVRVASTGVCCYAQMGLFGKGWSWYDRNGYPIAKCKHFKLWAFLTEEDDE